MSWYKNYKDSQAQGLLFYPWGQQQKVEQHISPKYDASGQPFYYCNKCGEPLYEDDVAEWYHPGDTAEKGVYPSSSQYLFPTQNIDGEQLKQEILQISNTLKSDIKNYEKDDNEYYINAERTRNLITQSTELNKYFQLLKADQSSYNYRTYGYGVMARLQDILSYHGQISNSTNAINDLKELLDNPQSIFPEIDKNLSTKKEFTINNLVPICEECLEDVPVCRGCNKHIHDLTTAYNLYGGDDEYACQKCIDDGIFDICTDCGAIEFSDEMQYLEGTGTLCERCYDERGQDAETRLQELRDSETERPFNSWFEKNEDRVYVPYTPKEDLPSSDQNVIDFLEKYNWDTSSANYQEGYAYQGKRKMRIGKILENLRKNDLKEHREISRITPEALQESIDFSNEQFSMLKRNFSTSRFRKLKKTSDLMIVISQKLEDIAYMSTDKGWTSCMNIKEGTRIDDVFCEVEDGGLIAYLIRENDKEIKNPLARVLIRRYVNDKGDSIAIVEETAYGSDPNDFIDVVKEWVDSKQGKIETGIYHQKGMEWTDSLKKHYEYALRFIQNMMIKLASSNKMYKLSQNVAQLASNISNMLIEADGSRVIDPLYIKNIVMSIPDEYTLNQAINLAISATINLTGITEMTPARQEVLRVLRDAFYQPQGFDKMEKAEIGEQNSEENQTDNIQVSPQI